jgi:prephenate dehydrogenase
VQDISPKLKNGSVIFDICSVKTPAVDAMIKHLPNHCRIIATHPNF